MPEGNAKGERRYKKPVVKLRHLNNKNYITINKRSNRSYIIPGMVSESIWLQVRVCDGVMGAIETEGGFIFVVCDERRTSEMSRLINSGTQKKKTRMKKQIR